ncbi:MAG: lytic transglycosylase domain-containing protein [Desulfobacterota bacterium]|nr:lytic transglycosylase domain-containing protein [Thermodesulfobacteriota bacterium]
MGSYGLGGGKRRLAFRIFLVFIMTGFFIHLSDPYAITQSRKEVIEEIGRVLERYSTDIDEKTRMQLAEAIYEESIRYNHDPKFILALIAIESSFKNRSVSEKGAMGLMQLMPYVAESIARELGIEWKGESTLFNPLLNLRMGIHYLSQLINHFEDLRIALVAYNYGPTYVKGLIDKRQKLPEDFYRKVFITYHTL